MYKRSIQTLPTVCVAIAVQLCLMSFSMMQKVRLIEEDSNEFRFHNTKAKLVVDKTTCQLRLLGEDDKVRCEEAETPSFLINGGWVSLSKTERSEFLGDKKARIHIILTNGEKASMDIENTGDSGFRVTIRCEGQTVSSIKGVNRLNVEEEIYGFGEMWNGHVAQRGQSLELWDKGGTPDECAYMPYYVSTNNYTFSLDYGGRVSFDVGQKRSDQLVYTAPTDHFDFLLVSGNSISEAVGNFLTVKGKPPVPPRWSFKPWFWLMSDPDQPEADISTLKGEHFPEMVQRIKKMNIPVGVTWFEPPWQDARTSFIPDTEFSSDLKGLIKQLSDLGVRTLAWTVPYTSPTAANWEEAIKNGYLANKKGSNVDYRDVIVSKSGEVEGTYYNYIDFFNPDAFNWWKKEINKAIDLGFKGFKPDAGQSLKEDAVLYGGRMGKDVHNSYAREYNRVFYESLRERYGNDFLMVPRAAWVGSSALTNFKWPGDLRGSFANNGLPSTVYSSLSLAFCGIPFVSTDIGGFQDRPSPELVWIRWAQFGAMLPGMQTLHMPWWYSKEAVDHFRFLAWFHTELTPLWMTLANEAHETGAPVCRPLVWNFQDDMDCWRIGDEFMVGEQLLVAPIINQENNRQVYLPEGSWIDFWRNDKYYEGKQTIEWLGGDYSFPLFIRQGAIIPLEVENDVTGFGWKESKGYTTLAIWPKMENKSDFILNDGEKTLTIQCETNKGSIKIAWDKKNGNNIFRIHIDKNLLLKNIIANGQLLQKIENAEDFKLSNSNSWYFDDISRKLWIKETSNMNSGILWINLDKS